MFPASALQENKNVNELLATNDAFSSSFFLDVPTFYIFRKKVRQSTKCAFNTWSFLPDMAKFRFPKMKRSVLVHTFLEN